MSLNGKIPDYIISISHSAVRCWERSIYKYINATYQKTKCYMQYHYRKEAYYTYKFGGSSSIPIIDNNRSFTDQSSLIPLIDHITKRYNNHSITVILTPPKGFNRINSLKASRCWFVPIPIMTLSGLGVDSGIVIHYCQEHKKRNWISIVWNSTMIYYRGSSNHFKSIASDVIESLRAIDDPYKQKVLLENIACISECCLINTGDPPLDIGSNILPYIQSMANLRGLYISFPIKLITTQHNQSDCFVEPARVYTRDHTLIPKREIINFINYRQT